MTSFRKIVGLATLAASTKVAIENFREGWNSTHWPITFGYVALVVIYLVQMLPFIFPTAVWPPYVAVTVFAIASVYYTVLAIIHSRGYGTVESVLVLLQRKIAKLESEHLSEDFGPPTDKTAPDRQPLSQPDPLLSKSIRKRLFLRL